MDLIAHAYCIIDDVMKNGYSLDRVEYRAALSVSRNGWPGLHIYSCKVYSLMGFCSSYQQQLLLVGTALSRASASAGRASLESSVLSVSRHAYVSLLISGYVCTLMVRG